MQLVSAVRSDAMITAPDVMQLAVYRHPWVWFLAWAVTFVCVVTLAYNERARRSYPTNWITLCIFTVRSLKLSAMLRPAHASWRSLTP